MLTKVNRIIKCMFLSLSYPKVARSITRLFSNVTPTGKEDPLFRCKHASYVNITQVKVRTHTYILWTRCEFLKPNTGSEQCTLRAVACLVPPPPSPQAIRSTTARACSQPMQGEGEYLFAPYSVFTVKSVRWSLNPKVPHRIHLRAALDNSLESEAVPLSPWY